MSEIGVFKSCGIRSRNIQNRLFLLAMTEHLYFLDILVSFYILWYVCGQINP